MRWFLPAAILLLAACHAPGSRDGLEFEPMWPNGIESWRISGGQANFEYEDNTLTGSAENMRNNSFLVSPREYDNFVLEAEVWIEPGGNSGIQIRSHERENGRFFGYQIEIDTSERAWSGGLYDEARRGWLNPLKDNEEARAAFKNGEWNHYRIQAQDNTIQSWVNGVPCANYTDTDPDNTDLSGYFGFQVHGGAKALVKWRNVRIAELD
ncbi:MAG: hypothetical protein CMJ94_08430 [Planctomycetes bacterium]|mgnify:CR=1 FL=1|nr:hypothetical protein [Planctomycetota bacterium]